MFIGKMDVLFNDIFTFTKLFVISIPQVFHEFSNLHMHKINGFVNVMTVAILIETKYQTLQILVVCVLDIKIPNTTHNLSCVVSLKG
jgi:hypothetical protein